MRVKQTSTAALVFALGLLFGVVPAFAQASNGPLSNLTAQWWQFIGSIPTAVNPGLDATGADCVVGQRGPVWFLAGWFGSGAATRNCSIPAGEWLFFPVVNYVNVNTPSCGTGNQSAAELRAQSAPVIDGATNLSVQVDGRQVERLPRVKSEVFAISFPADNIFGLACLPAGTYSPAVDDGFYVLLEPLKVGKHTLHIHGEIPSISFVLDVTYNLTVIPVLLK